VLKVRIILVVVLIFLRNFHPIHKVLYPGKENVAKFHSLSF